MNFTPFFSKKNISYEVLQTEKIHQIIGYTDNIKWVKNKVRIYFTKLTSYIGLDNYIKYSK